MYENSKSQHWIAVSAHALPLRVKLPAGSDQRICLVANDGHIAVFEEIVEGRGSATHYVVGS